MAVNVFFRYFFIFLLAAVLFAKCLYLFDMLPIVIALVGEFVFLAVGAFIFKKEEIIKSYLKKWTFIVDKKNKKELFLLLVCVSFVVKIIAILFFHINSLDNHPDIQVYVKTAEEIAVSGIVKTHAGYCLTNSHMYWFAMFLSPVVKLFGPSQFALSVYLSIVSTISAGLLFLTFSEQFSESRVFLILMMFSLLPSTILLPQYITHEHGLLLFLSLAMWLYFCILPKTEKTWVKIFVWTIFATALLLAYEINTAGLIMAIAIIICISIKKHEGNFFKEIIQKCSKIFSIVLILLLGSSFMLNYQYTHSEIKENYFPGEKVLWTLYVGSNTETAAQWSHEDLERFDAWPPGSELEDIHEFRKTLLIERYNYLFSHPDAFVKLICDKTITIWSVFTYPLLFSNETISDPGLQSFYTRYLVKLFVLMEYFLSVVAVWFCFFDNIRIRKKPANEEYLLLELFLMGYTAMLLLTECTSKYTIAMQPVIWIVCGCVGKSLIREDILIKNGNTKNVIN